jgi:hypothetical protein
LQYYTIHLNQELKLNDGQSVLALIKKRIIAYSFMFLIALSVTSLIAVNAATKEQLTISFASQPPKEINNLQTYNLDIDWLNSAKKSCDGNLLITIQNGQSSIKSSDLTLKYQGLVIQPKVSGNTLTFMLPKMVFSPLGHGTVSIQIKYDTLATYYLELGIVKA